MHTGGNASVLQQSSCWLWIDFSSAIGSNVSIC